MVKSFNVGMLLTRFRFQNAEGSSRLDDTRRTESRRRKQLVVLRLGPLPGLAAEHHHGHVQHRDPGIGLAGHGNHLYHQQPVPGTHPLAAPLEDRRMCGWRQCVARLDEIATRQRAADEKRKQEMEGNRQAEITLQTLTIE